MKSPEYNARQSAQRTGLAGVAQSYGANAAIQKAGPAIAQACQSGYASRSASATPTPQVSLPTDECSTATLNALSQDMSAGMLGNGPGLRGLQGTYGSQWREFHAYTGALPALGIGWMQYGQSRALREAIPGIEKIYLG